MLDPAVEDERQELDEQPAVVAQLRAGSQTPAVLAGFDGVEALFLDVPHTVQVQQLGGGLVDEVAQEGEEPQMPDGTTSLFVLSP